MKVAIVYDRVNKWGGAERVLLALHEIFPEAPLYTSVYDPDGALWAKVFPKVVTSFLQKIPYANKNHEFFAPLMPSAFAFFDFSEYDLVISVTSEAAKGIKTSGKTRHICYCLTPTRYLWSGYNQYFKSLIFKNISKPVVGLLRRWDKRVAGRPDKMIAISTAVQERIKKYYRRDSEIIFPPVDIPGSQITNSKTQANNKLQKHNYYLLVSRLDFGYKKVDLAINAFNKSGRLLVIVGTGREEGRLRRMAKDNIVFAGRVDEKRLRGYFAGAKALIMPQEEDFGIVAVEAQSYGVPVIAYKKGGAQDTVIDGKTGILFDKQNIRSLEGAIKNFEKTRFNKRLIIANAGRFAKERFKKEFLDLIKKMLN